MRVVDRKTFLTLPEGVVYAKGPKWAPGGLLFKGQSLENDWFCLNPCWVSARDSGEAVDHLDAMLEQGTSFPMEDAYGRDGYFDDNEVFLIFERADLKTLRHLIDAAITGERWK
jgi:hypothetical protein